MKKLIYLLFCTATLLAANAQKKPGLMEYAVNCSAAIRANGAETVSGTGLFFVFNSKKGDVLSLVTSRTLVENAQSLTFFFLEANALGLPQYGKMQEITVKRSDLTVINHPDNSVDLALIPVVGILNHFTKNKIRISFLPMAENVIVKDSITNLLNPVEQVLMIGHPANIRKELGNGALVKQGNTATPAFLDYNGKTETLVNIMPYNGSAGAPVFVYQNNNIDRNDVRMEGQRLMLLGIATAAYSKGFTERVGLNATTPMEDVSIITKSKRILEFKKVLDNL